MKQNCPLLLRIVLLVIAALFGPGGLPLAQAQSGAALVIQVTPTPGLTLKVYSQPSLNASVIATLVSSERMLWSGVMQRAETRRWLGIVTRNGLSGWITPDDDQVFATNYPRGTFGMNLAAEGELIAPAVLYSQPGADSAPVGALPAGARFRVEGGPVEVGFTNWWQVMVGAAKGWLLDLGFDIYVDKPLTVYGYPVCDVDITKFGVAGWDDVLPALQASLLRAETVQCLASANLRGTNSPVVVVLTRIEGDNIEPYDTLRVFEKAGRGWAQSFFLQSPTYVRTLTVGLHDFDGSGVPLLIWNTVNDGTGAILNAAVYQFGAAGMTTVYTGQIYKGGMQYRGSTLNIIEPLYGPNDANCCPSGLRWMAYEWRGGAFAPLADKEFPALYRLQSAN